MQAFYSYFMKFCLALNSYIILYIANGKGIEINTSRHRYGLSDLTPSRDILKLYQELQQNHKIMQSGLFARMRRVRKISAGVLTRGKNI